MKIIFPGPNELSPWRIFQYNKLLLWLLMPWLLSITRTITTWYWMCSLEWALFFSWGRISPFHLPASSQCWEMMKTVNTFFSSKKLILASVISWISFTLDQVEVLTKTNHGVDDGSCDVTKDRHGDITWGMAHLISLSSLLFGQLGLFLV